MSIKTFLQCALLSLGIVSAGNAMKMGEHFQMDAVARLGEMKFPSPVLSFPKGNQMGPQELYAQLSQLGEKVYDDALKTGNANYAYKQNNKAVFQNMKAWIEKLAQFTFSNDESYEVDGLLMHRNTDCFSQKHNIVLKEFCALQTADLDTCQADDIILVARITCFYN